MITSTILYPTSSGIYGDTDYEPQMVQVRTKNSATLFLESSSCLTELTKEDMLLSSIKNIGDKPNTLAQTIKRISVTSSRIYWVTPNVNIRNNNIQFYSSNTGNTIHSVYLDEGWYISDEDLVDSIVDAMNTLTGTTGLTFSKNQDVLQRTSYYLISTGGSYYFVNTCNAITKGKQCYNLPEDQVFTTTKIIGSVGLQYTTYVDFCSSKLSGYAKIQSKTNAFSNCVLFRLYLSNVDLIENRLLQPGWYFDKKAHPVGINFNYNDSLSLIDFKLYDEWGDILYVPTGGGGTGGQYGFNWSLDMNIEF